MKQKNIFILLALVVVFVGVIAGSFYWGKTVGQEQRGELTLDELRSQLSSLAPNLGQGPGQGLLGGGPSGVIPGGGGDTGTGAVGTVAEIEADIITLNTPTGTAWVLITDSTTIQMMGEGSLDDISPGQNVTVSGEMGDDGAIEATTVFISPDIKGLGGVGRKQR